MKNISLLLIISLAVSISFGQSSRIGVNIGYGTYKMSELETFQLEQAKRFYPLMVEATEKFPNYLNYSFFV